MPQAPPLPWPIGKGPTAYPEGEPPEAGEGEIVLTAEHIEAASTGSCGYTRAQLAVFGVAWPPKRGWKRKLVGQVVRWRDYLRFVEAKNIRAK